jgi:hypothetical protein
MWTTIARTAAPARSHSSSSRGMISNTVLSRPEEERAWLGALPQARENFGGSKKSLVNRIYVEAPVIRGRGLEIKEFLNRILSNHRWLRLWPSAFMRVWAALRPPLPRWSSRLRVSRWREWRTHLPAIRDVHVRGPVYRVKCLSSLNGE